VPGWQRFPSYSLITENAARLRRPAPGPRHTRHAEHGTRFCIRPGRPAPQIPGRPEKAITIRSARGHSFRVCELAVRQLASGRFPLAELATHRFGLSQADRAIRAVGGEAGKDVMHAPLLPWED